MAFQLPETTSSHPVNSGAGLQKNHNQIGGSNNRQYNAETIHINETLPRAETPPGPSSTILPGSDPNFIDREGLLEDINAHASIQGAWLALVGLGGIGYGIHTPSVNSSLLIQEQEDTDRHQIRT